MFTFAAGFIVASYGQGQMMVLSGDEPRRWFRTVRARLGDEIFDPDECNS